MTSGGAEARRPTAIDRAFARALRTILTAHFTPDPSLASRVARRSTEVPERVSRPTRRVPLFHFTPLRGPEWRMHI